MELEDLILIAAASLYKERPSSMNTVVVDESGKPVLYTMTNYEEAVFHARKLWEAVVADKFNPDGTINISKFDSED